MYSPYPLQTCPFQTHTDRRRSLSRFAATPFVVLVIFLATAILSFVSIPAVVVQDLAFEYADGRRRLMPDSIHHRDSIVLAVKSWGESSVEDALEQEHMDGVTETWHQRSMRYSSSSDEDTSEMSVYFLLRHISNFAASGFGARPATENASPLETVPTRRGLEVEETLTPGNGGSGEGDTETAGLLKHYSSFAKYAVETGGSSGILPLPLVTPVGYKTLLSIPLVTIIGVQKGGTTNLRQNLLTHPLVSGMPNEIHFFDRNPDWYPKLGRWVGDGDHRKLNPGIIGYVLTEYAKACLEEGKSNKRGAKKPRLSKGVIVESCPRYMLSPLAPYRMKMVRPQAKLVVVLRDPTERYFSQLRMLMCKKEPDPGFMSQEQMIEQFFHPPGWAKEYILRAESQYQPYTALCRGENATAVDLWNCNQQMQQHNPLHRGLYADQLERWFRAYNRSQIMIVDSAEMFADFVGTVKNVAEFAELPEYQFKYDPHEFSGECNKFRRRRGHNFFGKNALYERMLEEKELFREFYRPHNERLFELLGRDLGWNA